MLSMQSRVFIYFLLRVQYILRLGPNSGRIIGRGGDALICTSSANVSVTPPHLSRYVSPDTPLYREYSILKKPSVATRLVRSFKALNH